MKKRSINLFDYAEYYFGVMTFKEYMLNYLYDMIDGSMLTVADQMHETEEIRHGLEAVNYKKMKHSDFEEWIQRLHNQAMIEHPYHLVTIYERMQQYPTYLATEDMINKGKIMLIKDVEGIPRFYQNPAYTDLKRQGVTNALGENLHDEIICYEDLNNIEEEMTNLKNGEEYYGKYKTKQRIKYLES